MNSLDRNGNPDMPCTITRAGSPDQLHVGMLKPHGFQLPIQFDVVIQRQEMNGVFPYRHGKTGRFDCWKAVSRQTPHQFKQTGRIPGRIPEQSGSDFRPSAGNRNARCELLLFQPPQRCEILLRRRRQTGKVIRTEPENPSSVFKVTFHRRLFLRLENRRRRHNHAGTLRGVPWKIENRFCTNSVHQQFADQFTVIPCRPLFTGAEIGIGLGIFGKIYAAFIFSSITAQLT